ncbi:DMT family transporter [Nocardioides nitrophenolicus]|uniref:DMT family transporter n=1 Tax=Nocardioides nitrophenolicus TaxID=60489 RepID=UPI00195686C7|nr:DMT family transporter [Nocardioides nitrophenolicus]MBM7518767.1 drug/metabolite transporter (DMT)-like permease [Nocardioides nitrophenolicus]
MPDTPTETGDASLLPLAAVGVTLVLWASAFVGIRHLAHDFSAGPLSLGRLAAGALALAPVALAQGLPRPTRRQWVSIVTIGVLWFGIYNLSLNAGEQRVDAGTASMLLQVSPVLIAVLAALFLGERFTAQLAAGLALAFAGVVVIGLSTSGGDDSGDLLGVVLCLVPAAVYSISVILQKPLVAELSAVHVTWLACTIGVVTCLPWAGRLVTEVGDAPVSSTLWLVYLGVFPTAIAFTTYAYALRHMTASALGVTTYLVPPLTIVMGLVFLDEVPPVIAYAGGVLALLGVGVARRAPARKAVVAPAVPGRDPVA